MKFTTKSDLLKAQALYPPFGLMKDTEINTVIRTSGTSSDPLSIPLNNVDIDVITRIGARCFYKAGVREGMKVIHLFNTQSWAGGVIDYESLRRTGCCAIQWGVGGTVPLIELILKWKIEAISCTPSYLKVLKEVLKSKFDMTPKQLGLKLGLFGGEGGLQNQSYRSQIEEEWGMVAIDANYGSACSISMFAAEDYYCKDGLTFLAPDYLKAELKVSDEIKPIQKGLVGELVLSTNYNKGLINRTNYLIGDVIEILEEDAHGYFRFKILGRSDEMIVIKGLNVYPDSIHELLLEYGKGRDDNFTYQLHVDKSDPIQKAELWICSDNDFTYTKDDLTKLQEYLKSKLSLDIKVKYFDLDDLMSINKKVKTIIRDL